MSLSVSLTTKPCPTCGHYKEVFEWNITHNLARMADAAGIYHVLWRPEEIGITEANQLIGPLYQGLQTLIAEPQHYQQLNPDNGWGDYRGLVKFVTEYMKACQDYPEANVEVER